jgi:hypothetical protein
MAGKPSKAVVLAAESELVIELGKLRPTLLRAGRMFLETVLVPAVLLFVFMHTLGLVAGLSAVLSWCTVTVAIRFALGRHLPASLLVCVGSLCARSALALILSSALVYLIQPIIGSIVMAVLFLGSALIGKPITMRLVHDFVALPKALLQHKDMRRMFTQVALLWGLGRLIDAGMSFGLLRFGFDAGLLSRGLFSGILTALMICCCAAWGYRCIRRLPGVTLRLRRRPAMG